MRLSLCLCMLLTRLIILLATASSSQQSSRYQLYTSAAVSRYLLSAQTRDRRYDMTYLCFASPKL